MDGQEIKIIMIPCKNSSLFVSSKVTSCWSQLMLSSIQHLRKKISFKSHTNSSHLSNSIAPIDHMPSPCLHILFEIWKIIWDDVRISLFNFIISAYIPKVSPLCIIRWRARSYWLILIGKCPKTVSMINSFLLMLRCCSYLKIIVRVNVFGGSICIIILGSCIEVFLHHV